MPTVECCVCRKDYADDQITGLGDYAICADCKPIILERLREGSLLASTRGAVYGGFWIRVGAKLIDSVVLLGIFYVIGTVGSFMGEAAGRVFAGIMSTAIGLGYVTYFLGEHGATPGKMACGLKVVRSNNEPVSYTRAFGRMWAEYVSFLIFCIGYLMVAVDGERRSLHDRICDTRVVRAQDGM
jgi:uncharacterized RDD family membrane protein YckC